MVDSGILLVQPGSERTESAMHPLAEIAVRRLAMRQMRSSQPSVSDSTDIEVDPETWLTTLWPETFHA